MDAKKGIHFSVKCSGNPIVRLISSVKRYQGPIHVSAEFVHKKKDNKSRQNLRRLLNDQQQSKKKGKLFENEKITSVAATRMTKNSDLSVLAEKRDRVVLKSGK